jgi:ATP-dependent protease ClpP protease subunit
MTTLEIDVLGPIGAGYNQDPAKDFTSESVASALASKPSAVKLRINSPGGDCFDALACFNLLRSSGAKVDVEVLGLAASAASLIAMAGDSVLMATGSMMMLHNPWTAVMGNSNDLRDAADRLDKVRQSFLDIYQSKSGRAPEEVGAVMDDETWLTADEAVEFGFATGKLGEQKAQPVPSITLSSIYAKSWEPLKLAAMVLEAPHVAEAPDPEVVMVNLPPDPVAAKAQATSEILAQVGAESIDAAKAAVQEAPGLRQQLADAKDFLEVADANLSSANAKVSAAEAQAAALRSQLDQRERDSIVAKLVAERKTCPAQADFLASLSLEALRAYALTAPVVVPQSKVTEAAHASDGVDRWNGKSWAELRKSPEEMRALFDADPELFKRMQTTAQKRR